MGSVTGVDFAGYLDIYGDTFKASNGTIPIPPANDTIVVGKRVVDPRLNGTTIADVNDPIDLIWINATARPPTTITFSGHITAVLEEIGTFGLVGPSDSGVYIPISQAQILFGTNECDTIIVKLKSSDQAVIDNASTAIKNAFSGEVSVVSATAVLSIISERFLCHRTLLGRDRCHIVNRRWHWDNEYNDRFLDGAHKRNWHTKGIGNEESNCASDIPFRSSYNWSNRRSSRHRSGMGSGKRRRNSLSWRRSFYGNSSRRNGGMTITPILTPQVFLGALAFGIGVSVIFALYPAWRASNLNPWML